MWLKTSTVLETIAIVLWGMNISGDDVDADSSVWIAGVLHMLSLIASVKESLKQPYIQ